MKKFLLVAVLAAVVFGPIFAGGGAQRGARADDGRVTLRVVDWSDSVKPQRDIFHSNFMRRHPNVNVEYTMLTIDQFRNTALVAIQAGDAPDLFPIPVGMRLALAVSENWFVPMENYVTRAFIDTIDPNFILEGYQKLDGVLYVLPEWASIPSAFLFYNKE